MSIKAFAWAWELPELTPAQRLVLLCLADHADHAGLCWPSLGRITVRTGLSRATVIRALREMTAAGVVARAVGTGRASSRYRLVIDPELRGVTVIPLGNQGDTPGASQRHPRGVTSGPEPVIEAVKNHSSTAVGVDNGNGKSRPSNRAWAWEQTRKCLAASGRGTLDLHPHVQAVIRAAGGMARLAADTEVAARVAFYAAWRQLDGTEETA